MLDSDPYRQMPIRLPHAGAIRHAIAERAAEVFATSVDHFLGLLGPVEPAFVGAGGSDTSWRLAYYQGSQEEHRAIEQAVGQIQRQTPLMRAI